MRRSFIVVMLMGLMLICHPASAEKFSDEELQIAVIQEFPDWAIWRIDKYGSGKWQDEIAMNCDIGLFRLIEGQLELKSLYAFLSPLKKGDRIPWEVTEWVTIPLSEDAVEVISSIPSYEVASHGAGFVFSNVAMSGSAEFMLDESMTWNTLIAYPDYLVGIAQGAEELQSLRIAHWNGSEYTQISALTPQKAELHLNATHSYNDSLELYTDEVDVFLHCDSDGIWRMKGVNNGGEIFNIHEKSIEDITFGSSGQNNINYHYGYPVFASTLEEVNFNQIPRTIADAIPMLNAEGLACTKTDNSKMYDSPDGRLIAICYSRAVGQIIEAKGEWVHLQFGSKELGLSGWFLSRELSFGKDIEEIISGFPSYSFSENESQHLEMVMPDITLSLDKDFNDVWLIGRSPDGGWLVNVNEQQILFADETAFSDIGPAEHGSSTVKRGEGYKLL